MAVLYSGSDAGCPPRSRRPQLVGRKLWDCVSIPAISGTDDADDEGSAFEALIRRLVLMAMQLQLLLQLCVHASIGTHCFVLQACGHMYARAWCVWHMHEDCDLWLSSDFSQS